jgi:DNA-binding NtrC family response regulator
MNLCLIDDDPIRGETLAERLTLEGFGCRWLRDGAAAGALDPAEAFDAFISDVRLPDTTGPALFVRLQPVFAGKPWIFITGYGTVAQREALLMPAPRNFSPSRWISTV